MYKLAYFQHLRHNNMRAIIFQVSDSKHLYSIFYILLSLILLFFSYFPVYSNYRQAPAGSFYYGATGNYPLDMIGNLASVYEGYLGHLRRFSKTTTTIYSQPTFIKFEYLLIGHLARIFNSDPLIMFYLTRFIITILFLIFIGFVLIPGLFNNFLSRIIAAVLVLFSTGILPAIYDDNIRILLTFPPDIYPFQRLTTTAHHYLLGSFFSLLAFFFLSKAVDSPKKLYYILPPVFGFLTAFVFTPSAIMLILSLPVFIILYSKTYPLKKNYKKYRNIFILFLTFIAASIIPVVYLLRVSEFFDFNTFYKTEQIAPYNINPVNYIFIVGISYLLALFSISKVFRKSNTLLFFFLSFTLVHPIAVFLLPGLLSVNKIRFFLTPYHFIFAFLATYGILSLSDFFHTKFLILSRYFFIGLFTVIPLFSSWYVYSMSFNQQKNCFCQWQFFDYGNPKKDLMDAIFWLRKNSAEDDIVLSGYYAGTLIPAFSGNKVYTSWWFRLMQPDNFKEVSGNIQNFFSGNISPETALSFLKKEKINFIFFSDEEMNNYAGSKSLKYPFLKPVFQKNNTIIYQVDEKLKTVF